MIEPYVQPGTTTAELNERCHDYMVNTLKVIPAPSITEAFPNQYAPLSIMLFVMAFPMTNHLKKVTS